MQRRSLVFLVFLVFLRKFPEATSFGQFETVDASRARAFPLNDVDSSCTSVDIKLATSINNIYIYIYIPLAFLPAELYMVCDPTGAIYLASASIVCAPWNAAWNAIGRCLIVSRLAFYFSHASATIHYAIMVLIAQFGRSCSRLFLSLFLSLCPVSAKSPSSVSLPPPSP
jgi:hypothetical protein